MAFVSSMNNRIFKKALLLLLSFCIIFSSTACSVDSEKKIADDFIVSLLSVGLDDIAKVSLPSDSDRIMHYDNWKKEAIRDMLSRSSARYRNKDTKGDSKIFSYEISYPDISVIDFDNLSSSTDFTTAIDNASLIKKTFDVIVGSNENNLRVTNSVELMGLLYDELLFQKLSFYMPNGLAIESIDTKYNYPSLIDINELSFLINYNDEYFEHNDSLSLSLLITVNGEPIYDEDIQGQTIDIHARDLDTGISFYPQGSYEFSVYNYDEYCVSLFLDISMSNNAIPDGSFLDDIVFTDVEENNSLYNVSSIEGSFIINNSYEASGRDYQLGFELYRDEKLITNNVAFSFNDQNNSFSISNLEEGNYQTGIYTLIVMNYDSIVGNEELIISSNFNEDNYLECELSLPSDNPSDEDDCVDIFVIGNNADYVLDYTEVEYDITTIPLNLFDNTIDAVLASGDGAPDLIICDSAHVRGLVQSEAILPINSLGISYDELGYMYEYTLRMASDNDGIIKALSWNVTPGAVFYNRYVASEVLGVCEPDEVAPFFDSWDSFLETSRLVDESSNGRRKIVSGLSDCYNCYFGGNPEPWITDGSLSISSYLMNFLDFASIMNDEELTFNSSRWGSAWSSQMSNYSVLSYFGTIEFGDLFLSTTGTEWGIIPPPEDYFEGGYYIMATSYSNMTESAATIMRDITLDQDNLRLILDEEGILVNSINVHNTLEDNVEYNRRYLGGQNPYHTLSMSAWHINADVIGAYDNVLSNLFYTELNEYLSSGNMLREEFEEEFQIRVEELGIV